MTHEQYEVLSNQAVAACAVVYFLAVLAHLAQWALGRQVEEPVAARRAGRRSAAAPGSGSPAADARGRRADESERMELFGRIGVALTVVAAFLQFIAVVSRGLAAGPGAGAVGKHVRVHPDRHLGGRGRLPAALPPLLAVLALAGRDQLRAGDADGRRAGALHARGAAA